MNPGPSPCSLRLVLPFTPVPESGPTLATQLGALSQDSQPCAPAPAPSPSQIGRRVPPATGSAAPPAGGMALPMPMPPGLTGAAAAVAPPAPGHGGQRQPAVPTARAASAAHVPNPRE